MADAGPIRFQRSSLVKGHLIDTHPIAKVGKKTDEWFTDRAGSHNMDDSFHGTLALDFRQLIAMESPTAG
jgi:hypothetical protein